VVSLDRQDLITEGGGAKAGLEKEASIMTATRRDRGRQRERAKSIITTQLPATPSYTRRPLGHSQFLYHSTRQSPPLDKRPTPPNRPSTSRRISALLADVASTFHHHIFLSIGAHPYKQTLPARHHSTFPAEWPTSLRLRQQILTTISQTSTNPRSLRNPSTTPLPPPWIKKLPLPKRCCPPSLAAS